MRDIGKGGIVTLRVLLHNDKTAPLSRALTRAFPDADVTTCNSYEDLPVALRQSKPDVVYTVRFAGSEGYPREALFGADGPRWVSNGGAGTDHFGVWDAERITVTNAAGVAADMMSEYIMGAFLHFSLDLPGLLRDQQDRIWRARTVSPLRGRVLVIAGMGQTGQALAARAKAFGMQVYGTRARPAPMENTDAVIAPEALPELLSRADYIAVCTPLTKATHGLLGQREFDAVKRGAVLANVSRGGVVDEAALQRALMDGRLAGAALDVFATEPLPADHPFWRMPSVIVSPHCSSVYEGWEAASFEMFLENLRRWVEGKPLCNVVDPGKGY
ncbi:D-2-hydroxyacid dehydrogenase [uncultured Roseobacter sp.]|uniref:D-2-hydroxyacid dehydrogenase n=1 Tax=uncultured Roseobacter sp. TaxID=114847 RepID=UPI002623A3BB|nr:D-2-hydroxyacid dehydrogenase [uncultured Roseobacter sp.]